MEIDLGTNATHLVISLSENLIHFLIIFETPHPSGNIYIKEVKQMILNKKLMIPSTFLLLTCHIVIFTFGSSIGRRSRLLTV